MRILLDENMPRKLVAAVAAEGHEVDSVKSLQLQGIDNGGLYQLAASNYDLCFTRDAEFSRRVLSKPAARLKLVHVVIRKPGKTNSCSNSSPHFGRQIGRAIKAATIGPPKFALVDWSHYRIASRTATRKAQDDEEHRQTPIEADRNHESQDSFLRWLERRAVRL